MDPISVIDLKKSILADNDADAEVLRGALSDEHLFYVNLMSSPGSGKTTTLLATLARLKGRLRAGVMEADIDSDVDARTVRDKAGVPAVQLHTGGMCHLDADMSRQGLKALREAAKQQGEAALDLVFLENVGNLVCPAEFDTGAHLNVVILSITEGHDKPLKYPLMFEKCDAVLINKIDALPVFDFDFDKARDYIRLRSEKAAIFPICAKTGEGVDAWCDWLMERQAAAKKEG